MASFAAEVSIRLYYHDSLAVTRQLHLYPLLAAEMKIQTTEWGRITVTMQARSKERSAKGLLGPYWAMFQLDIK